MAEVLTPEEEDFLCMQAECELARRSIWQYCQTMAPKFYKESRPHLKRIADEIQDFYCCGDEDVLIITMPPRMGKSRTGGKAIEWILGHNPKEKIMTATYNERLSTAFSRGVRDTITEAKGDRWRIVFSDIFPGVQIKKGEAAANMWSLQGGYYNYLATSPGGTATGFGANIILIEDLIKNENDANNLVKHEDNWEWLLGTMESRAEEGCRYIVIMTRWHMEDIPGKMLKHFPDFGYSIRQLSMPAISEDGQLLCPDLLSAKSIKRKRKSMRMVTPGLFEANYQQTPLDAENRLYSEFKTYHPRDIKPGTNGRAQVEFKRIAAYTDQADTGSDATVSFIYGETFEGDAYVLDAFYSEDKVEVTEPQLAEKIYSNKVHYAEFEANNGGKGYAREVQRAMLAKHPDGRRTVFHWFHQSKNKAARIFQGQGWLQEHLYFPVGWKNKWPEVADKLQGYLQKGKNPHDDVPDAATGIYEMMNGLIPSGGAVKFMKEGL